jgi:pimeloyl-ACP methyl ester carboxylesterase
VVLVHGGFVDGSGWQPVYDILTTGHGYRVSVVQNPTLSLEGDVAATRQVIDQQPGPVVLAGHSYGGVVITEAGTHDKVAALTFCSAGGSSPRIVSETIRSCQHILAQDSPRLLRFFQYGAVSRLVKRIEPLKRRLQSFAVALC